MGVFYPNSDLYPDSVRTSERSILIGASCVVQLWRDIILKPIVDYEWPIIIPKY